jgi:predicted MPP superfamily phosphohydrolase
MRFVFSGIGIVVYTGLCTYIGARLFTFVRYFMPWTKALIYWVVFILLCYAFVFVSFMRVPRLHFLERVGSYWMAVFIYLLLFLPLFDLLRLGFFLFHRNALTPRFTALGIGAALCLCFIIITYGAFHAGSIRTVQYAIRLAGQRDGLRAALISDLHIGSGVGKKHIAKAVNVINRVEPDIVFIAGDIFDGNLETVRDMPGIAAELRRIRPPLGVYACLGNHDVDRMFPSGGGTERIEAFLRDAGIMLLLDGAAAIGDNMYIAGRRDARPIGMKAQRKTASELFSVIIDAAAPPGSETPRTLIVLDHQPTQFAEIETAGADLVLSGHTHRGQLFPANLITKIMYRKMGAAHYGYWRGNTLQAVITSGAGYWGPPLRVATNSEVAVIDVTFGDLGPEIENKEQ